MQGMSVWNKKRRMPIFIFCGFSEKMSVAYVPYTAIPVNRVASSSTSSLVTGSWGRGPRTGAFLGRNSVHFGPNLRHIGHFNCLSCLGLTRMDSMYWSKHVLQNPWPQSVKILLDRVLTSRQIPQLSGICDSSSDFLSALDLSFVNPLTGNIRSTGKTRAARVGTVKSTVF